VVADREEEGADVLDDPPAAYYMSGVDASSGPTAVSRESKKFSTLPPGRDSRRGRRERNLRELQEGGTTVL